MLKREVEPFILNIFWALRNIKTKFVTTNMEKKTVCWRN